VKTLIDQPVIGKFPLDLIEKIVYSKLGAHRSEILVGPSHGCDNAVIKLGNNQVLVVTADPLSMIPALGVSDSAWLSVNLLASDLATCGFPPQFMMVNLCLPPSMSDNEFEEYWSAFHSECKKLGIAILGGHTGRYVGCDYTIIGGGVMMALAPENQYLASNMSKPGDLLIMTKGVAIAATGILARVFPETIKKAYGSAFLKRAQQYFSRFSVVEDALTAASAGLRDEGVTSMHDVTEGGLLGALYELSEAAKIGLEIELSDVIVTEEAKLVCDLFNIDSYSTLSEGTLIISVKPKKAQKVLQALKLKRIKSKVIGKVTDLRGGRWIKRNGVREALKKPSVDPYWEAYWKAYQKGWK
jgi:hydrogenase expression/formation protein HypE